MRQFIQSYGGKGAIYKVGNGYLVHTPSGEGEGTTVEAALKDLARKTNGSQSKQGSSKKKGSARNNSVSNPEVPQKEQEEVSESS